jgi:hypothetical protein
VAVTTKRKVDGPMRLGPAMIIVALTTLVLALALPSNRWRSGSLGEDPASADQGSYARCLTPRVAFQLA